MPDSALGRALSCTHDYWGKLIRYVERGDIPIDNNRVHADSWTMLGHVMRNLPALKTVEEFEALLPGNLHAMDLTCEMIA